jgi:hypothetical protein
MRQPTNHVTKYRIKKFDHVRSSGIEIPANFLTECDISVV